MSERDLQRIIASVQDGPEHERLYSALIRRSGVAISPGESWALWHVAAYGPIHPGRLAERLHVDAGCARDLFEALGRRGYLEPDAQGVMDLSPEGRDAFMALVTAGQKETALLIRGHELADDTERAQVLARLTEAALATMPADARV